MKDKIDYSKIANEQCEHTARLVSHYFDYGIRKEKNVFGKLDPSDEDYDWQWEYYTLEDYCMDLRRAGFLIESLLEPKPDPAARPLNPEKYDHGCNYPIFVLIRAIKAPDLIIN